MTYDSPTPRLGLVRPNSDQTVLVSDINGNSNKVDTYATNNDTALVTLTNRVSSVEGLVGATEWATVTGSIQFVDGSAATTSVIDSFLAFVRWIRLGGTVLGYAQPSVSIELTGLTDLYTDIRLAIDPALVPWRRDNSLGQSGDPVRLFPGGSLIGPAVVSPSKAAAQITLGYDPINLDVYNDIAVDTTIGFVSTTNGVSVLSASDGRSLVQVGLSFQIPVVDA